MVLVDKVWKSWKYKNLTLAFLGVLVALWLSKFGIFHEFLTHLGSAGYAGAFVAGILFVSTFTVATGAVILFTLAEYLHPLEIALLAGLGSVIGDLIIFHLVRDDLASEIKSLYNRFGGRQITRLLHTKYFNWTLPVVGAILIASPLPDEIGVSLMGIAKMKTYQFILISFVLNMLGIFLLVLSAQLF